MSDYSSPTQFSAQISNIMPIDQLESCNQVPLNNQTTLQLSNNIEPESYCFSESRNLKSKILEPEPVQQIDQISVEQFKQINFQNKKLTIGKRTSSRRQKTFEPISNLGQGKLAYKNNTKRLSTEINNNGMTLLTIGQFDKTIQINSSIYSNCLVHPLQSSKIAWRCLLTILILAIAIIIPINLAFTSDLMNENSDFYLAIDILFTCDMMIEGLSIFENQEGKLVQDLSQILICYIKGWFLVDLTTNILSLFASNFTIRNLARIARIMKIQFYVKSIHFFHFMKNGRITNIFIFFKVNSHYTDILRFSIIILFLIHLTGCLWFYISTLSPIENWFYFNYSSNDISISTKYLSSAYYVLSVLTTVGYGNIVSQSVEEYIFTIFFMFFAVIIYSWMIGALTYSFSKITEQAIILKNKYLFCNQIVANYDLNRQLQEKLLRTSQTSLISKSNISLDLFQFEEILKNLPEETTAEICSHMFNQIIKRIPFFLDKPPIFISKAIQKVKSIHLNPGDLLYPAGIIPKEVYIIISGRVITKIQSVFENYKTLVYVEGSFFGEVDIIFQRTRKQCAYAETKCEIWRIQKNDFLELICHTDSIKLSVLQQAIQREELLMKEEMKLLRIKLKDDPNLRIVLQQELLSHSAQPQSKDEASEEKSILNSENSFCKVINQEIELQSKKKAFNKFRNKEVKLTNIVLNSTQRYLQNKQIEIEDYLSMDQQYIKLISIDKMLQVINNKTNSHITRDVIKDLFQQAGQISQIQKNCSIIFQQGSKKQCHDEFKDIEVEEIIDQAFEQMKLR